MWENDIESFEGEKSAPDILLFRGLSTNCG